MSNEDPKPKPAASAPTAPQSTTRQPTARQPPVRQPTAREPGVPAARGTDQRESTPPVTLTRNNSGRVKFDDRGNAVWEWAVSTGSFATDVSTSRLKKLENDTLSLADDAPTPASTVVKPNLKGAVQGYSPYDSGLLAKTDRAAPKKKDLRRLGEFIKLREQANRNKRDKE